MSSSFVNEMIEYIFFRAVAESCERYMKYILAIEIVLLVSQHGPLKIMVCYNNVCGYIHLCQFLSV